MTEQGHKEGGIWTDDTLLKVLRARGTDSIERAAADRIEEYCTDAAAAEEALLRVYMAAGGKIEELPHASSALGQYAVVEAMASRAIFRLSNEQSGWISIKDRLPTPRTTVLAVESSGNPAEPICVAFYNPGARGLRLLSTSWLDAAGDCIDVSHWMPLPEAPQ